MLFLESNNHRQKIVNIINDFKYYENNKAIEKTFLNGSCYDFALILWRNIPNSEIIFIKNFFKDSGHYVLECNEKY